MPGSKLTNFRREAMERATYTTKSFLIALALVKKQLSIEQAAKAAQIEVDSQIQRWGEVEDCEHVLVPKRNISQNQKPFSA